MKDKGILIHQGSINTEINNKTSYNTLFMEALYFKISQIDKLYYLFLILL